MSGTLTAQPMCIIVTTHERGAAGVVLHEGKLDDPRRDHLSEQRPAADEEKNLGPREVALPGQHRQVTNR
jgi:hypothetical protein